MTYDETVKRLFPKLMKRDGLPEGELKAAEARLARTLPAELRAMYRLAGRRHDLHGTWDRLITPKNLIVVNRALVFYEEHDRTRAWAIRIVDIEQPDPPVVSAANEPPYAWAPDHDAVSQFFLTELLWTHVRSDPCATVEGNAALPGFEPIELAGCHWDVVGAYAKGSAVAIVRGDPPVTYVGASSAEELAAAIR